jgi:ankyrin repeat protein
VLRNYLHIIVCLTEVEGYSECLNDELKFLCLEKSRGMFRDWIDLNAQDCKGNTPLHIASMRGNSLMAEALCDAGADPDGIKNKEGQ